MNLPLATKGSLAMSKRLISSLLFTLAAGLVVTAVPATSAEPGLRHTFFMAGSIIESSADGVYICIGSPDGARVGQTLEVVRITRTHGPKQSIRFKREKVGTVRVDAIVDEHFAQATVTSGRAKKGDVVRSADPVASATEE